MRNAHQMGIETRIERISRALAQRSTRRPLGLPSLRSGSYRRVHHGWYLPVEFWEALSDEDRHLARLLAIRRAAATSPVFSHVSAAVLLDLPIYGESGSKVHTIVGPRGSGRPSDGLIRHKSRLHEGDIVEIAGLRCTSPERTLLDLSCTEPAELALACVDGYLRSEFRVDRSIDRARLGEWQHDMERRLHERRAARGIRTARTVFALATPTLDSVLESVSHLQLRRLGFELELQVPVPGPNGRPYYVDFEFLGLELFGECDGKAKYTDPELRGGLTAEQLVYRDKRRQDWICGSTGKGLIRWGHPDVLTVRHLARRLRAFNVPIPRPPN